MTRRVVARAVGVVIAAAVVPLTWLFSVAGSSINVFGSTDFHNKYLIWAWGWYSRGSGWFGLDPYTTLGDMQGMVNGALTYAIFATLFFSTAIACYLKKREWTHDLIAVMGFMLLVGGFIILSFNALGGALSVNGTVQCVGGFECLLLYKWTEPSDVEKRALDTRVHALMVRVRDQRRASCEGADRAAIKGLYSLLESIQVDALVLGIAIDTKDIREDLSDMRARCELQERLAHAKEVSIDMLRVTTGLTGERFAGMLIEMCDRFDLVIESGKVKAKDGREMDAIVTEVDALFTRWRGIEAQKWGKV